MFARANSLLAPSLICSRHQDIDELHKSAQMWTGRETAYWNIKPCEINMPQSGGCEVRPGRVKPGWNICREYKSIRFHSIQLAIIYFTKPFHIRLGPSTPPPPSPFFAPRTPNTTSTCPHPLSIARILYISCRKLISEFDYLLFKTTKQKETKTRTRVSQHCCAKPKPSFLILPPTTQPIVVWPKLKRNAHGYRCL